MTRLAFPALLVLASLVVNPDAFAFQASPPLFQSAQFRAGPSPVDLASGDFTGDGVLDVVVTNFTTNRVSLVVGDGSGGFALGSVFPVGTGPVAVASGDLDGDGDLDVVAASSTWGSFAVLLGNGQGSFAAAQMTFLALSPSELVLADVDGDGALDAVATNPANDSVTVALGNGLGALGSVQTYPTGDEPVDLTVVDWNHDGVLDVVTANRRSDDISILVGHGPLGFAPPSSFFAWAGPTALAMADLDGNGWLDVIVTNSQYSAQPPVLSVLYGTSYGGFLNLTHYSIGSEAHDLDVADLDGDGMLDLLPLLTGAEAVAVLLGDAQGGFDLRRTYGVGRGPEAAVLADFDGDGRIDLATADKLAGSVTALLGDGDGGLGGRGFYPGTISLSPSSVAIADVSGDGRLDVVTAAMYSGHLGVFLGDGQGRVTFAFEYPMYAAVSSLAIADFDEDGDLDVVTSDGTVSSVSVVRNDGDAGFGPSTHHPVGQSSGSQPAHVAVGDLDADGDLDLVSANQTSHDVSVLLGDGQGGFAAARNFPGGVRPYHVAIGDVDEDGNVDVVVVNALSNYITIFHGDGQGGLVATGVVPLPLAGRSVALGDFDSDGHLDLAATWDNYATAMGGLIVRYGDGQGGFGAGHDFTTGVGPRTVLIEDLNGDGRDDIAVGHEHAAHVAVLVALAQGGFAGPYRFGTGPGALYNVGSLALAAGDLDDDGNLDLVGANHGIFNPIWLNRSAPRCGTEPYGQALPNSTGATAAIGSTGTPNLSGDDFMLACTSLPANRAGVFFFGDEALLYGVPFGNGYKLVGGTIRRLPPVTSNALGVARQIFDLSQSASAHGLSPGAVRYFQLWYRDPTATPAGSNLSNGLKVRFCE